MTCYEHLRQHIQDRENYDRLNSYFNALELDKTDEYHDKHGRKKE